MRSIYLIYDFNNFQLFLTAQRWPFDNSELPLITFMRESYKITEYCTDHEILVAKEWRQMGLVKISMRFDQVKF